MIKKSYDHFKLLDIGDHIFINGKVFTTKQEISFSTSKIILSADKALALVKEKDGQVYDAFSDKEQRYRNRHLDLILNSSVKETLLMIKILKKSDLILIKKNFLK